MREEMSDREQRKVLHQITQDFEISQIDLAKKIGKSRAWVDARIKLALNLEPEVATALEKGTIGIRIAEIISSVDPAAQRQFLSFLLDNNIKEASDVRKAKKRFLNRHNSIIQ
jgi:ParB-like chromosome segregation protein Spo0J